LASAGASSGRSQGELPASGGVCGEEAISSWRGIIEIELGSGVRVDAAVDEAALGRVLRALGR
jgi:hypothetical protein